MRVLDGRGPLSSAQSWFLWSGRKSVGQEEKYFDLWREMTPPTGGEENAGVGVAVTALPSPGSHGIGSFWS